MNPKEKRLKLHKRVLVLAIKRELFLLDYPVEFRKGLAEDLGEYFLTLAEVNE